MSYEIVDPVEAQKKAQEKLSEEVAKIEDPLELERDAARFHAAQERTFGADLAPGEREEDIDIGPLMRDQAKGQDENKREAA